MHGSEPTNKSYRTDESYIKVKGEHKYLYRAVRRLNYEFAMDTIESGIPQEYPSTNGIGSVARATLAQRNEAQCLLKLPPCSIR